jgi:N-acetyl sugar amidotransferase
MHQPYKICQHCVMDTSDPDIRFDAAGICHHCEAYDARVAAAIPVEAEAAGRLQELVDTIRREGASKEYDCVIGVSGGVDSTYVALRVKQLGLRPLAVHLDNGWDTELAVKNIENLCRRLDIDLHTEVLDWDEFRDLQLAFLRASTPDSEIPSDHAIVSTMRLTAQRIGVRYIISGFNARTESHLPAAWSQGHYDWKYIKSVHERFGRVPLRTFPRTGFLAFHRSYFSHRRIDLLNYDNYVKSDAMKLLERELDWKYYGGKHYESIYTRFYQGYILPRKFGYDKRRTHLSSLICSGEISREQALQELAQETYPVDLQLTDREYVIKKLGITAEEFERIMQLPKRSYWDFPSYGKLYRHPIYRGARALYRALRPGGGSAGAPLPEPA